jgi:molybdenum cofactor biosynthesis protein A
MITARPKPSAQLTDPMGRTITYLRVSLTERCNLRCRYCYGSETGHASDHRKLSDTELLRLLQSFASVGITKVRFTGGEPLLRPDIVGLVRQTSALDGISLIGMTTNGLLLEPKLPSLIEAGLNRLNISLDTLDRDTFRRLTGYDRFDQTYESITNAEKSGAFDRVKVNTVVMRGINDNEIRRFAAWALERRIELRFIEFMPACGSGWNQERFVGEDEIKTRIGLSLEMVPANDINAGPAQNYYMPGYPGRIGFISAISHDFCSRCNRLRLTSSGKLVGCLFGNVSVDLMPLIRDRAAPDEIAEFIRDTVMTPGFRSTRRAQTGADVNPSMRRVGG